MKVFQKISLLILALLMSAASYGQDIKTMLEKVQAEAAEAFVSLEYSAEVDGTDGAVKDHGVIEAQDKMWHLKGTMLEIYTDADATWILEGSSKEAYVEPAWSYDDLLTFYQSLISAGSTLDVKVLGIKVSEKQPLSVFTPKLSSDWVITDLR